jgi:hypothetical protein
LSMLNSCFTLLDLEVICYAVIVTGWWLELCGDSGLGESEPIEDTTWKQN